MGGLLVLFPRFLSFILDLPSREWHGESPKDTGVHSRMENKNSHPLPRAKGEHPSFRYKMWRSCHACFTTKGWGSLQVQYGSALFYLYVIVGKAVAVELYSLFSFLEYTIFFTPTRHSKFTSNPPAICSRGSQMQSRKKSRHRVICLSVYNITGLRLQLSFLKKGIPLFWNYVLYDFILNCAFYCEMMIVVLVSWYLFSEK